MARRINFALFSKKLKNRRAELLQKMDSLNDSVTSLESRKSDDWEGWASMSESVNIYKKLEHSARLELKRIDQALRMIDEERYGTCRSCEGPIERQRLEVLLIADQCVDCAHF